MKLSADVKPDHLVALIDSRAQKLLDLAPLRKADVSLATGDSSLQGLDAVMAVERKSLTDLLRPIFTQGAPSAEREITP